MRRGEKIRGEKRRRGEKTRGEKTRKDEARQDKTGEEKRRGKSGQDKNRGAKKRKDKTRKQVLLGSWREMLAAAASHLRRDLLLFAVGREKEVSVHVEAASAALGGLGAAVRGGLLGELHGLVQELVADVENGVAVLKK